MKTLNWISICIAFVMISTYSIAQKIQYKIDLTDSKSNSFRIEVKCPKIETDIVDFNFLTSVENGDVRIVKYSDLVLLPEAKDALGNTLKVTRDKKTGGFKIYNAKNLSTITYRVVSTWKNKKWDGLFPPSGTCYEYNHFYYFTSTSILGSLGGMEKLPVDLEIIKPADLSILTGNKYEKIDDTKIAIINSTFKNLMESPFVVAKSEIASIDIKGTEFQIAVYSENRKPYLNLIKENISPYLQAIGQFFPEMPLKKYCITIYIKDVTQWGDKYRSGELGMLSFFRMLRQIGKLGFGANGYRKGTSFCIADIGNDYYLTEGFNSTLIHEFIHIVNPYKLFYDTEYDETTSKNNWLWEGATSYFEQLAQLKSGILCKKEFFNIMRTNIYDTYNFPKEISLEELCEKIDQEPYGKHLMQVYWTGSVVSMLLDFEIMRLTDGNKTLKTVIFELADKYSSQKKSINENNVIPEIVSLVKPELQTFFDRYVTGKDSLDFNKGLDVIGFEYYKSYAGRLPVDPIWTNDIETGKFILPPDSKNPEYVITKVGPNDFVGFKKGDRVKRYDIFKSLTNPDGLNKSEETETTLTVIRDNKPVELKYKIKYRNSNAYYFIKEKESKTPIQEKLLKIWLSN